MKYSLLYFLLSLFLISSCAPKTAPSLTEQHASSKIPTERSLLWKIEGKELPTPSYLYGTIHLINKDDFFITDSTQAVFNRAQQVAFEVDMERMNDMNTIMGLMGQIMMSDNTTLKDLLSKEDYAYVSDYFEKMGLPMMMLERMKPMFLSAMTSGDFDASTNSSGMSLGQNTKSYELEFMQMAKSQNKEIQGLETIEYQMSVFDSIPYKEQAQLLVESMKMASEEGESELDVMTKLYQNQDIQGMVKLFKNEQSPLGKYEDIFLLNRNRNWIPVIEKLASQKMTFFAVGAGHLGGENGVITLLRKAGFTLSPVFSKAEWGSSGTKM